MGHREQLTAVGESDLLIREDTFEPDRMDSHAAHVGAPCPGDEFCGGGRGRPPAAAIREAVFNDVPDGASGLSAWWRSITSAWAKCGAASSAKRAMRTAPTAKLGTTRHPGLSSPIAGAVRRSAPR